MRIYALLGLILLTQLFSQNDEKLVRETIQFYIDGTSYTYPEKIKKAFHEESILFLTKRDGSEWNITPNEYSALFEKREEGTPTGRIGNIISVDLMNDIATVKAEILIPSANLRFIDAFLLKKTHREWKIISKTATKYSQKVTGDRILFIVSNASFYGKSDLKTGNSYSEIVNAYHTFREAGYIVDFVSPEGGAIPLAYIDTSDERYKQYLYDNDFMNQIKTTLKPSEVNPMKYKAVHYIGGGSAMFGVATNKAIQKISMDVYEKNNGIISSVCHGTAGIVYLKEQNGKYLVKGKRVNGYPDSYENPSRPYFQHFPFLIQKTIEENGGTFLFSPRNTPHVEVDGRLVTGQNYLSSEPVAKKIIEMLEK